MVKSEKIAIIPEQKFILFMELILVYLPDV